MDNKSVLIIDDEPEICDILRQFLQRQFSFQIRVANNPDEALDIFRKEEPQLVIMDFNLGGPVTGADLLKMMKEETPSTIVIMISGQDELEEKLISEGADAFFAKPCDSTKLHQFIEERCLSERRF